MTRRRIFGCLAVIMAGLLVGDALGQQGDKVELRLRLKKGDVYQVKQSVEQKITQEVQGQKMEIAQTFGFGYLYVVEQVDAESTATVKITYYSVAMKQDGLMGHTEYDSTHPPEAVPMQAKPFAGMLGQGFTMKITPEGEVKEVKGVGAMLQKMLENSGLPEGPMRDGLISGLKNQFSDEGMKEMMGQVTGFYPKERVGVGDTWKRQMMITKGLPMIIDSTYKLKSRKDGVAKIEAVMVVKPNPKAKPMDMGIMKIGYKLGGKQQGTFEINEATGMLKRSHVKQKLSGTIVIEGMPNQPEGMTLPMTVESEEKVEVTKGRPKEE